VAASAVPWRVNLDSAVFMLQAWIVALLGLRINGVAPGRTDTPIRRPNRWPM
jgi:hypothetical protein